MPDSRKIINENSWGCFKKRPDTLKPREYHDYVSGNYQKRNKVKRVQITFSRKLSKTMYAIIKYTARYWHGKVVQNLAEFQIECPSLKYRVKWWNMCNWTQIFYERELKILNLLLNLLTNFACCVKIYSPIPHLKRNIPVRLVWTFSNFREQR